MKRASGKSSTTRTFTRQRVNHACFFADGPGAGVHIWTARSGGKEAQLAALLGIASALTFGAADFLGGLATKRAGEVRVVLLSQAIGSAFTVALLLPFGGSGAIAPALGWGFLAGLGGGAGVLLLYRGLARGRMAVVAPVTGVEAAVVPVLFGLVLGERPSVAALIGVALALVAVVLVSAGVGGDSDVGAAGLPEALGAGACFGLFFIALDRAGADTGVWPLVGARAASLSLVLLVAAIRRAPLKPPAGSMPLIAGAGLLDVTANGFYLVGVRQGLLSLVAVLTSMYPAATVALARIVLKERLVAVQLAGIVLALIAVILIGVG